LLIKRKTPESFWNGGKGVYGVNNPWAYGWCMHTWGLEGGGTKINWLVGVWSFLLERDPGRQK